jgi:hypothetical protein
MWTARRGPIGRVRGGAVVVPPVEPGDTLVHGASVQITALNGVPLSGMGTKPASVPSWKDMEDGAVGDRFGIPEDTPNTYPDWCTYPASYRIYDIPTKKLITPPMDSPLIRNVHYDNTQARGGSHCTKSVLQAYGGDVLSATQFYIQSALFMSCKGLPISPDWFCSFWRYLEVPAGSEVFLKAATNGGSRNWKHIGYSCAVEGQGLLPQMRHDVYPQNLSGTGHHVYFDWRDVAYTEDLGDYDTTTTGSDYLTDLTTQGTWQRFDYYVHHGTVGDDNFVIAYWIDGVLKTWVNKAHDPSATGPVHNDYFTGVGLNRYLSQSTNPWDDEIGAYGDETPSGDYTPKILPCNIWTDDIYLSPGLARIELGNAATWAACTHREIQPWTAWAANAVTITVNHGVLAHGTQYLYAIKPDGTPFNANGHPVVLG